MTPTPYPMPHSSVKRDLVVLPSRMEDFPTDDPGPALTSRSGDGVLGNDSVCRLRVNREKEASHSWR